MVPSITVCAFKSKSKQFVFSLPSQPALMFECPLNTKGSACWGEEAGVLLRTGVVQTWHFCFISSKTPHITEVTAFWPEISLCTWSGATGWHYSPWEVLSPPCSGLSVHVFWAGERSPPLGLCAQQGPAAGRSNLLPMFAPKGEQTALVLAPRHISGREFHW